METELEEVAKGYSERHQDVSGNLGKYLVGAVFQDGAEWQQEQILDFLYKEITERRDYSASKMCEKVIEFIKQFKNK
jgi:hypothetical protein